MKALTTLANGAREAADDDAKIKQHLSTYVGRAFKQLYLSMVMQLEVDRTINERPQTSV
jgi:hypothetical protein